MSTDSSKEMILYEQMIRNYTINWIPEHITGILSGSHGPAGDVISFSFFFFFFFFNPR